MRQDWAGHCPWCALYLIHHRPAGFAHATSSNSAT